jgi:hypothetical protein
MGRQLTDETKRKISESWTPERRQLLGAKNKGFSLKRGQPALIRYIESDGYWHLSGMQAHPLSKRTGVVAEHRMVLYDSIGPGPHSCHWGCGKAELTWDGPYQNKLTADHINGNKHDNRPENLVPSCHVCNSCRAKAGDPPDWTPGWRKPLCGKGHDYTPENTGLRKCGQRYCRECARVAARKRARRGYEADPEQEDEQ